MNRTAFKIAASTLIVSLTMASGPGSSGAMRRYDGPSSAPADRNAARLHDEAARAHGLAQVREEAEGLVELFLVEKLMYELGYEVANRPDWVSIPLAGLAELLGAGKEEAG